MASLSGIDSGGVYDNIIIKGKILTYGFNNYRSFLGGLIGESKTKITITNIAISGTQINVEGASTVSLILG